MITKTIDLGDNIKTIRTFNINELHLSYDIRIVNKKTHQLNDSDDGEPAFQEYFVDKTPSIIIHYVNGKAYNKNKNEPTVIEYSKAGNYCMKFFNKRTAYHNDNNFPALIYFNKFHEIERQIYYNNGNFIDEIEFCTK